MRGRSFSGNTIIRGHLMNACNTTSHAPNLYNQTLHSPNHDVADILLTICIVYSLCYCILYYCTAFVHYFEGFHVIKSP